MESNLVNERESLLLNVERQIFTNQEQFDNNFQKNEPLVKKNGVYVLFHRNFTSFVSLFTCIFNCISSLSNFYLLIVDTGKFSQLKAGCCNQCSALSSREFWFGMFPIIGWLSKYSVKDQLMGDVMSGCTDIDLFSNFTLSNENDWISIKSST